MVTMTFAVEIAESIALPVHLFVAVKSLLRPFGAFARVWGWLAASVTRQLEHPVPTPSPGSGCLKTGS